MPSEVGSDVDGEVGGHLDEARARLTEQAIEAMEALPTNPSAAMRVLWVADSAQADAAGLAAAIELDPGLTAKVLRISNSAYYAARGGVTSVARAVVSVGFGTIKALATASITGLDETTELPELFWEHAAQVAHATGLVARHFAVPSQDALPVGLLHDLGEGLLCRVEPVAWRAIETSTTTGTPERLNAEQASYGLTHPEIAGRVLTAWQFPPAFVRVITEHERARRGNPSVSPLAQCLVAGEALAELHCSKPDPQRTAALRRQLDTARISADFIDRIGARLLEETAALSEALRS